jgi:hypothetical protein
VVEVSLLAGSGAVVCLFHRIALLLFHRIPFMLELNGGLLVATSGDTLDESAYLVIDLLYPLKILASAGVFAALWRLLLPVEDLRLAGEPFPVGLVTVPCSAVGVHLGLFEVVAFGEGGLLVLDETTPAEGLREGVLPLRLRLEGRPLHL